MSRKNDERRPKDEERSDRSRLKKNRLPKGHKPNLKYPDRWSKYLPLGQIMPETRFIAFKTPLSSNFFDNKSDVPFMIPDIIQGVEKYGKKLGIVIDLTATTRYYESAEWGKHGVQYEKLFCPGHTIHNQPQIVRKFNDIVDKFFRKHKDDNFVIGVHCTHGINRTGYLICRYLIEKGWSPGKAIAYFETSRGIKIERHEYITALHDYKKHDESGESSSEVEVDAELFPCTEADQNFTGSRRYSKDTTTWRKNDSSWPNSNQSSSWRPSSSNDNGRNHNHSMTRNYREDSWIQNNHQRDGRHSSNHLRETRPSSTHQRETRPSSTHQRDVISSSAHQRDARPSSKHSPPSLCHVDAVQKERCEKATKKLCEILDIGSGSKDSKK